MARTKWTTSNTPLRGVVFGTSTVTPPALAANSVSTASLIMAGLSTGDVILQVDPRGTLSTDYLLADYAAGSSVAKLRFANVHGSTVSHTTSVTFAWCYLDRT